MIARQRADAGGTLLRLFAIEARRTIAPWFAPLLLAFAWLTLSDGLKPQVVVWFWIGSSVKIAQAVAFIGPCCAGVAAWMAGCEHRQGLDDLLAMTPRPAIARTLATWAATTLWGLLAYAVIAAAIMALTAQRATWGGPEGWPILIGALAIPAHAALGYALGRACPGRFTAPLVAIGSFTTQIMLGLVVNNTRPTLYRARFLSPLAPPETSVWYGLHPVVAPRQGVLLLGLAGCGLAALALVLSRGRSRRAAFATLLSLALVGGGAGATFAATPQFGTFATDLSYYAAFETRPYTPVCSADPLVVCVHPAYQPLLADLSRRANDFAAPLLGLPGMPTRAEQVARDGRAASGARTAGAIRFMIFTPTNYFANDTWVTDSAARQLANCAIQNCFQYADHVGPAPPVGLVDDGARQVIVEWLNAQTRPVPMEQVGVCRPPVRQSAHCQAALRFSRLGVAEQRAWLTANFAALREGRVRLADLP